MPYAYKKRPAMYKKKTYTKAKKSYKKYAKPSTKAVRTMVKKEIARNIENKITTTQQWSESLLTLQTDASTPIPVLSYTYSVINPYNDGLFSINQGTSQSQRVGNRIKLKRWVIKGSIYFDPNATIGANDLYTQSQGYVDVYIGRKTDITGIVLSTLDDFYQNGNQSRTPDAALVERTMPINKDDYKIYKHFRCKIGNASSSAGTINNNDYKINREFGFDICKFVLKNHIIKYDDNNTTPQDALLSSICMWATYTQPNANVVPTNATPVSSTFYSPVKWDLSSYAEYEDA